ncbi:MAG: hypothetical protein LCI02_11085 [Proteobacteria bacterium]|nr:hypothetical protein [Pseudomonadota bacterium]
MANITKVSDRASLKPRSEPYWLKLSTGAYIGFRRMTATSIGTWIAYWRDAATGKKTKASLGDFEHLPPSERYDAARKAADEWFDGRAAGIRTDVGTVRDACVAYVEHLRARGNGPANDALGRLERRVIGREKASRKQPLKANPLAALKLDSLRLHHLKKWRAGLPQATRAEKASSQRDLNTLKAVLNFARGEQMVSSDEAWSTLPGFDNIGAGNTAREYLTVQQRRQLLDACEPALRDLLEGLALLGARPIELARATVADYDAHSATLSLWSMKGKPAIKRVRSVPLKALPGALALVQRLAKAKLPGAPLWTRADGLAWQHSDHDELVRAAALAAGMPGVTAYALRHAFITDAVSSGAPIDVVGRVVGTSAAMIEKTYGKLVQEHAIQAFAGMAKQAL